MNQRADLEDEFWLPVIGRSLAFLCLHYAEMRDKTLLEQVDFLAQLGVSRKEAASILGTSENSIRSMVSQRSRKAVKKRAGAKKKAGGKRARNKAGGARGKRG